MMVGITGCVGRLFSYFFGDFSGVFAKMTCGGYGFCPRLLAKKGKTCLSFSLFRSLIRTFVLDFSNFLCKKKNKSDDTKAIIS